MKNQKLVSRMELMDEEFEPSCHFFAVPEKYTPKRQTKNEKLLRDCHIRSIDKEFEPPSEAFERLSVSIHANERVKLREVDIERVLESLNTPRLNRCFHSISTIFTHQYKKKGKIQVGREKVFLSIDEEDGEREMSFRSLIRYLTFPDDQTFVQSESNGIEFPVYIDINKEGFIRAIMIKEDDESKMDLKKEALCNIKIITPTHAMLIVRSDFTKVITAIRPRFLENSTNCKVVNQEDLMQPQYCKSNQIKSRDRPGWRKETSKKKAIHPAYEEFSSHEDDDLSD